MSPSKDRSRSIYGANIVIIVLLWQIIYFHQSILKHQNLKKDKENLSFIYSTWYAFEKKRLYYLFKINTIVAIKTNQMS